MKYKKREIERYLDEVKQAIRNKRYSVSAREKNERLFIDFVFTEKMREQILLNLCVEDFCGTVKNEHPKYAYEILYIFGKSVRLLPRFGRSEKVVHLYIKINKLQDSFCIIISFHEQEYPLKYVFQ